MNTTTNDRPRFNLFLDDTRYPEYIGVDPSDNWYHARNVEDAKEIVWHLLSEGEIWENASLDHDLGACQDCLGGLSIEDWLRKNAFVSMPNCEHFGTGYTFVQWMIENEIWPTNRPRVHSMNPVGRKRMEEDIEKYWRS